MAVQGARKCLIVVDMQYDFITGTLAVPGARDIVQPMQAMLQTEKFDVVVFTQDWHDYNHSSFKEFGGPWPRHCVKRFLGAEIHKDIDEGLADVIIRKGQNPKLDSYSAFMENDKKTETGLYGYLAGRRVNQSAEIYICGLAKDFCVKWTAEDALLTQSKVYIMNDLTKSVFPEKDIELDQHFHKIGVRLI